MLFKIIRTNVFFSHSVTEHVLVFRQGLSVEMRALRTEGGSERRALVLSGGGVLCICVSTCHTHLISPQTRVFIELECLPLKERENEIEGAESCRHTERDRGKFK